MVLRFEDRFEGVKDQYEHLWETYLTGNVNNAVARDCYYMAQRLFDDAEKRADLETALELSEMMLNIGDMINDGNPAECALAAYATGQEQ